MGRCGASCLSADAWQTVAQLTPRYHATGLNPVPPELWMLPYWIPFHPGRMWCHARMVYLPMSYIYGNRYTATPTPLIEALRSELYTVPYAKVCVCVSGCVCTRLHRRRWFIAGVGC